MGLIGERKEFVDVLTEKGCAVAEREKKKLLSPSHMIEGLKVGLSRCLGRLSVLTSFNKTYRNSGSDVLPMNVRTSTRSAHHITR